MGEAVRSSVKRPTAPLKPGGRPAAGGAMTRMVLVSLAKVSRRCSPLLPKNRANGSRFRLRDWSTKRVSTSAGPSGSSPVFTGVSESFQVTTP